MALGPKEMEAAIIANLKNKSGKDLNAWIDVLSKRQPKSPSEGESFLKQVGLGTFQARVISMRYFRQEDYQDDSGLVASLFSGFEEQLNEAQRINGNLQKVFEVNAKPCKGYLPVYFGGKIAYSMKPTDRGLYLGICGSDYDFETVPHKTSLGGSQRMKLGFYSESVEKTVGNLCVVLEKLKKEVN